MDTADGNDTATAIWFLNEEYDGQTECRRSYIKP